MSGMCSIKFLGVLTNGQLYFKYHNDAEKDYP